MTEPRFAWNARGDLLCGEVKVGSVRPGAFAPLAPGDGPAPWFGEVGSGFPAPFTCWFDSREEAEAATLAAARRLMFGEGLP